jgi:hypothetical protein
MYGINVITKFPIEGGDSGAGDRYNLYKIDGEWMAMKPLQHATYWDEMTWKAANDFDTIVAERDWLTVTVTSDAGKVLA